MIYHYDVHIHSVLSPCADCLMTPNNILNMAMLKGLNIISVTDHNSLKQLPVLFELSKSYDILLIPGVEVTTKEGYHVLIYFKTLEDALKFDQLLDEHRPNEITHYGMASITDIEDMVIDTFPFIASDPIILDYQTLTNALKAFQHRTVLAHVDRPNTDILDRLNDLVFNGIELTSRDELLISNYGLSRYPILYNSDAHDLLAISETLMQNTIELESLSIDAFFRYFQNE